jgi:hypothetical protein
MKCSPIDAGTQAPSAETTSYETDSSHGLDADLSAGVRTGMGERRRGGEDSL